MADLTPPPNPRPATAGPDHDAPRVTPPMEDTMSTSTRTHPYRWLFDPATLGHYTLPEEITTAARAVDRLSAHRIPAPERTPAQVVAHYEDELLRTAETEAELPGLPDLAGADTDTRAAEEASRALRRATEQAKEELTSSVRHESQTIIVKHLRPAHAEVVARAAEAASALREVGSDPVAIAQADARTRKSIAEFEPLVQRYTAIRASWGRLVEMGNVLKYPQSMAAYAELRHPGKVWPDYAHAQHQVRARLRPPWQAGDQRARLLWIAGHAEAGGLWMPTAGELNAAVAADSAEGMSNLERARWAREAVTAMTPSG